MSKHMRMHSYYNQMSGITADEPDKYNKANSTLVHDDSCFPVREAMRLAKAAQEWANSGNCTGLCIAKTQRLVDAQSDYRKAVAKMKARKGKK